jgi:hypothetical protein
MDTDDALSGNDGECREGGEYGEEIFHVENRVKLQEK